MGKRPAALVRLIRRSPRDGDAPRGDLLHSRVGFLAVTVATVLWAFGASVAGRLFHAGVTPLELVEARTYITAVGLGLLSYVWHTRDGDRASVGGNTPRFGHTLMFGLAVEGNVFLSDHPRRWREAHGAEFPAGGKDRADADEIP
ncbi:MULTISPECIES: hypothetical protein [Protofrankia]|uniref:EamA domain-containing protein n=1 Tax=Candidatus Protofrankia datiscae TaxID=2716812 RepID=F8AWQ7_9ACTN|nr:MULTISPECIES: hypothetical protein [Protofrankia]AEH10282.1 hypothetical protein FsymDg_2964 [Candidatus Protofrankia datiscae]